MNEKVMLEKINSMCEESLSPEVFEKWECVKFWLEQNRKDLK